MKQKNRLKRALCNQSGASMLFVLGVILLLFAVGISVYTATTASSGTVNNRFQTDTATLYAQSMQQTILSALSNSKDDEGTEVALAKTLGAQLLALAYRSGSGAQSFSLSPTINSAAIEGITDVTIAFDADVAIAEAVEAQEEIKVGDVIIQPAQPRIPRTATINMVGDVTVTVRATYLKKTLVTVATYSYSGGLIQEIDERGTMAIQNSGEWGLVAYDMAQVG